MAGALGRRHHDSPGQQPGAQSSRGGDGEGGTSGGDGLGGGAYNGAAASLRLERSTVTGNHANGGDGGAIGAIGGEGIGGGVYDLGGFDVDVLTVIEKNHASTSQDDVFDL